MQWLTRVDELNSNRMQQAKNLKVQGKTVIGYFCCFVPLELMTALDLVPYRIMGSVTEGITQADTYLETIMCPFVRSSFDLSLKGVYDFLDGLVVPHSCDTIQRIYDIWLRYHRPAYSHFVNVPHMLDPSSFEFFENELSTFKKSLEKFVQRDISDQSLRQAIQLHNENRRLLRELYELRKNEPPLISGTEIMKLLVAGVTIPVTEYNELVRGVTKEVKERKNVPAQKRARILVYGAEVDDAAFIELVEESGANVVMDEMCLGTRTCGYDVVMTDNLLGSLSRHYLEDIQCPRTYRPKVGTHQKDLENRFGYFLDYAREFKVNGVILYITRYCDTFELDAPDLGDYLREAGLPVLNLENDYSVTTFGQLRTRVQTFLEMIL